MPNELNESQRQALSRSVMELLDAWQVAPADQINLLGLGTKTQSRMLIRFRSGTPLPNDQTVMKRASDLLAIGAALLTAFPHSIQAANLWVTTPNINFGKRTPLSVMLENGADGIERILRSLDNTGGW